MFIFMQQFCVNLSAGNTVSKHKTCVLYYLSNIYFFSKWFIIFYYYLFLLLLFFFYYNFYIVFIFYYYYFFFSQKLWKMFFISCEKLFYSWNIQIFLFLSSLLFLSVSHCFKGWLNINLKVYDVINCLNKNSITHFVWYLDKKKTVWHWNFVYW